MAAPYPDGKGYVIKINASFRMLVDMGKVSDALSIFAPGQSGHLASKHCMLLFFVHSNITDNDFTANFIRGKYNDMYFTREDVERNKEGILTLQK